MHSVFLEQFSTEHTLVMLFLHKTIMNNTVGQTSLPTGKLFTSILITYSN